MCAFLLENERCATRLAKRVRLWLCGFFVYIISLHLHLPNYTLSILHRERERIYYGRAPDPKLGIYAHFYYNGADMVDGCAQNKNCAKCVFWLPLLVSIEWGLYLFRTYSFHVVSFTPPASVRLVSICTRESCASLYNVIHLAQKRSNDNRFTDKMRTFHTDASFHCLVHFHSIYTMERKKMSNNNNEKAAVQTWDWRWLRENGMDATLLRSSLCLSFSLHMVVRWCGSGTGTECVITSNIV